MTRSALLLPAFAALSLSLGAQEVRQQGMALTLPASTDAQRWDVLSGNFVAFIVAGIAHAKSLGKTADDFGRFTGTLVAKGWGPPKSGTALQFVRGLAPNFAGYPGADVQVTATSDTSATLRLRRSYLAFFGPTRTAYGVTADEYEHVTRGILASISQYLGLRSTMRVEGDWATVTVTGRGSAAPASTFPIGTYAATFSDSVVKAHPQLAGAWEITYMPNGHHTLRHDGSPFIEGDYEVTLDQIAYPHAEVGAPGITACSTPATYQWSIDPRTKNISFQLLADDCAPRIAFATNVTLKKR